MARLIPPIKANFINEETGEVADIWAECLRDYYFALGSTTGQLSVENNNIISENDEINVGAGDTNIYFGDYLWDNNIVTGYIMTQTSDTTWEWKSPDEISDDYETGMIRHWGQIGSMPGWLLLNGGTIGNIGSGATTRASANCEDLFILIWNQISDTYCPVIGGRGASAAADWARNKQITLPVPLGHTIGAAGTGVGLTERSMGEYLGDGGHTLTVAEEPAHYHAIPFDAEATIKNFNFMSDNDGETALTTAVVGTKESSAAGQGQAHENRSPFVVVGVYIKL